MKTLILYRWQGGKAKVLGRIQCDSAEDILLHKAWIMHSPEFGLAIV